MRLHVNYRFYAFLFVFFLTFLGGEHEGKRKGKGRGWSGVEGGLMNRKENKKETRP
jgi:hypothetical protein